VGDIHEFFSSWQVHFSRIIQGIPPGDRREFWLLIGTGKFEDFSDAGQVFDVFKDVGLLHLLVLSGSQVGILIRIFRYLGRSFRVVLGMHPVMSCSLDTLLRYFILWFYVGGTGFSAPLVRAALVQEVNEATINPSEILKVTIAFLIHICFFGEQLTSTSFILSWASFGGLLVLGQLMLPKWFLQCCLSVLCHLLVVALKDLELPGFGVWLKILVSNVLFLGVFDLVVFPLVAVLVLMSLVIWFLGDGSVWGDAIVYFFDSLMLIYDGIAGVILCAIETIRYI